MDFNQILELVKTVSASELTTFQYEEGNQKILMHTGSVVYQQGVVEPVASAAPVVSAAVDNNTTVAGNAPAVSTTAAPITAANVDNDELSGNIVDSPLVGRFYLAPAEDAEPFVKVGDTVKKGQTLAIVEAMKLMNEIESEYDGVVTKVLAENGEGVEYGQPLFCIS